MNDLEAIRRLIALYPQLLDAKRLEASSACSSSRATRGW
jgi:hypothetical protein